METPDTKPDRIEALRAEWTDQFVRANPARPELKRFADTVGRVVTVNFNGKAIVDFQDGAWYDITAAPQFLIRVDAADAKGKYDAKVNSAQPYPEKQA
jgi:hypothetical protein